MYQSGQSVSSIASSLGTSVSVVDSYLGIASTVAVPTSVGGHGSHAAPAKAAAPAAPSPAATSTAPAAAAKS
jgi:hypothetical protein